VFRRLELSVQSNRPVESSARDGVPSGTNGKPRPVKKKKKEKDVRRRSKKRKTVKRCTSPSHFLVPPAEEVKFGPDFTLELPGRDRVDSLLRAVSKFYYRPKEIHPSGTSVWVNGDYDSLEYPTIDLLLSPLRKPNVMDGWSPKEIALFEAGICCVGKNFHQIQKLIPTKTTQSIVEFYYNCWKKSTHYQIWKQKTREMAIESTT